MTPEQKEKIATVLDTAPFCVISTISPAGMPQSALTAVSRTPQFEIVIGTSDTTRKFHNITENPQVAVVVGWEKVTSLQIEGVASVVTGEERVILEEGHCKKNPVFAKLRERADQQYIKITPIWARYTSFLAGPPEVWEITF